MAQIYMAQIYLVDYDPNWLVRGEIWVTNLLGPC